MQTIEIALGELSFTANEAGEESHPLVLLLHGFPQTRHTWRHQLPALARAGFRAVAPDQRGYSAGARPSGIDAYRSDLLVADALGIADALGAERFHLVGHDWGGQLAWLLAARRPERLHTLAVLSRPHPAAFARALEADADQPSRSRHHRAFQDPETADRLLAADLAPLRNALLDQGVAPGDVDAYLEPLGTRDALDAALNWYRAGARGGSAALAADVPAVSVPTLYVWGNADATVGEAAAKGTAACLTGPYRFEVVPGAGHFLTDQAPDTITGLLLAHLGGAAT